MSASPKKQIPDLIRAATSNDIALVKNLLKSGADPNQQDDFGTRALDYAVFKGNVAMMKVLLKAGADPNGFYRGGYYTIHNAAAGPDSVEPLKLLIKSGADVNALRTDGYSTLDMARANLRDNHARILVEHGAKTGRELRTMGMNPYR